MQALIKNNQYLKSLSGKTPWRLYSEYIRIQCFHWSAVNVAKPDSTFLSLRIFLSFHSLTQRTLQSQEIYYASGLSYENGHYQNVEDLAADIRQ